MPRYLEDPSPTLITKKTFGQKLGQQIEDRFNSAAQAVGFGAPSLPPGGSKLMTQPWKSSVPSLDDMFSGKKRAKIVTAATRG